LIIRVLFHHHVHHYFWSLLLVNFAPIPNFETEKNCARSWIVRIDSLNWKVWSIC
jgi:hypothetical protein